MKNKKGFTLIELIAVIAIIASLSLIVGLNMKKMLDTTKEKKYNAYKEEIQNAACVYAEQQNWHHASDCPNNPCRVTFETLKEAGLVSKNLLNPKTKKTIDEELRREISITWINNEKKCELQVQ